MRNVEIDCRNICSPKALQIYLQYCLDFPDWYGRNLDALYDMLTESCRPLTLTMITGTDMEDEMRTYLKRLERVLADAADENDTLTCRWIEK